MLIHPAENFASGHRYIVAMRNLKDADGNTLSAPGGLPLLPRRPAVERVRRSTTSATASTASSTRSRTRTSSARDLYLAWDFTVDSDENIAKYTLAMRNQAFADLGDTNLGDGIVQGNAPTSPSLA